ncbi:MAG: threo-3-hydroxy-L-aspartate ammonia-lyase [Burkholderiaceae bacterium]
MPFSPPDFFSVKAAANRLDSVAHRTPVLTSSNLNKKYGAEFFFKCENFQRMGAFKFRGGYNALSCIPEAERAAGVVAYSSGNHAQAIALSAQMLNMPAVIVMPDDAPALKLAATRGYGAEVVLYNRYTQDRSEISAGIAKERGSRLIPPYDHPDVIAGQGTASLELFEQVKDLDMLFICLGGGGLLAGGLLAAQALNPKCAVYGVEPEAGNDGQQSFRKGEIVSIPTPKTIADGAQTQFLGELTFPIIKSYARDILSVSDDDLIQSMRFFFERMKMVVEPTGCLSLAGALSLGKNLLGKRVGVLISGGNVDSETFCNLLARAS